MMDLQLIQNKIYEIRSQRVMLDFDLAVLYETETNLQFNDIYTALAEMASLNNKQNFQSCGKKMINHEAKVKAQRAIKELEKKRSEKRQNLFEAQDTIDERKEELLTEIETRLKQSIRLTELFTIKWKLV